MRTPWRRSMGAVSMNWVWLQALVVILVVIGMVIAVVKLA